MHRRTTEIHEDGRSLPAAPPMVTTFSTKKANRKTSLQSFSIKKRAVSAPLHQPLSLATRLASSHTGVKGKRSSGTLPVRATHSFHLPQRSLTLSALSSNTQRATGVENTHDKSASSSGTEIFVKIIEDSVAEMTRSSRRPSSDEYGLGVTKKHLAHQ